MHAQLIRAIHQRAIHELVIYIVVAQVTLRMIGTGDGPGGTENFTVEANTHSPKREQHLSKQHVDRICAVHKVDEPQTLLA
jgi:hypothetical protein